MKIVASALAATAIAAAGTGLVGTARDEPPQTTCPGLVECVPELRPTGRTLADRFQSWRESPAVWLARAETELVRSLTVQRAYSGFH